MHNRRPLVSRAVGIGRLFLAVGALTLFTPRVALAYIDPLSGSLVIQALIAGVLGAAFSIGRAGATVRAAIGRVWRRLTG